MAPNITEYIKNLKKSRLVATCLYCEEEFHPKDALLFDGTKQFPGTAELTKEEWEQNLVDRIAKLKKQKQNASAID